MKTRGMKYVDVTERAGPFFAGGQILACQGSPEKARRGYDIFCLPLRYGITMNNSTQRSGISSHCFYTYLYILNAYNFVAKMLVFRIKIKSHYIIPRYELFMNIDN